MKHPPTPSPKKKPVKPITAWAMLDVGNSDRYAPVILNYYLFTTRRACKAKCFPWNRPIKVIVTPAAARPKPRKEKKR